MRTIKFRGMDITGDMHYGNLAILTREKKGHYISNRAGMPFACLVIPETIGQYAGRKDKNGKELYEGDRIEVLMQGLDRTEGVIEFRFGAFGVSTSEGRFGFLAYLPEECINYVGNIHEKLIYEK